MGAASRPAPDVGATPGAGAALGGDEVASSLESVSVGLSRPESLTDEDPPRQSY
jgi:hypothetical protein